MDVASVFPLLVSVLGIQMVQVPSCVKMHTFVILDSMTTGLRLKSPPLILWQM